MGQVKLSPLAPVVIVWTVLRSPEAPFFRVKVTGPSASSQVISNVEPASMSLKLLLVRWTLASTSPRRAARTTEEMVTFILDRVEKSVEKVLEYEG